MDKLMQLANVIVKGRFYAGKLYDQDRLFMSQVPHFGTHEILGDPLEENEANAVIEALNFGWWDTHHQDGGTYQLPVEEN